MVPRNSGTQFWTIGFAFYCQVPTYKEVLAFMPPSGLVPIKPKSCWQRQALPWPELPSPVPSATVPYSFSSEGGSIEPSTHCYCMKYIYCIYKRPDLAYLCLIYNCAFWRPQRKPVSSLGGDVVIQPLAIQVCGWVARLGEIAEGQLWKPLPPPPPYRELITTLSLPCGKYPACPCLQIGGAVLHFLWRCQN